MTTINVKGIMPCSFVDWPGKVCAVLFMGGCRLRCPWCHNKLIAWKPETVKSFYEDDVWEFIDGITSPPKNFWVDGLTISGGEPTDDPDTLFALLSRIQDKVDRVGCDPKGFLRIKLDTNGTNPNILRPVVLTGLISAVYMDVKAKLTPHDYSQACSTRVDINKIRESVSFLKTKAETINLEVVFRTTRIGGIGRIEDVRESIVGVPYEGKYAPPPNDASCPPEEPPKTKWKWISQPFVPPVMDEGSMQS